MVIINNVIRGVIGGILIPDLEIQITEYGETSELTVSPFDSNNVEFINQVPIIIMNDGSGNWAQVLLPSNGITFEAQFFIQNVFLAFQKI